MNLTNGHDHYNWWDENEGEIGGVIYGLAGDDTIAGDNGNDLIDGGEGNDSLYGGIIGGEGEAGSDQLYGNDGFDWLRGYGGNDYLDGGNHDDELSGGNNEDTLLGGNGNDLLDGEGGNDTMYGGQGADAFTGGTGIDTVSYLTSLGSVIALFLYSYANTGTDAAGDSYLDNIENLTGSNYDDSLGGNNIVNVIHGLSGRDFIYGYDDNDFLYGDDGSDGLNGGPGQDTLDGGANPGTGLNGDWASYYAGTTGGVTADLMFPNSYNTGDAQGDVYINIENLQGGSYADYLLGDNNINLIQGDGGNDILEGRDGNDLLYGEAGDDKLIGGVGQDLLDGGVNSIDTASYITSTAFVHVDLVAPGANLGDAFGDSYVSIEDLEGTTYEDDLRGNGLSNIIYGGGSNDFLAGRGGNDFLYGEGGNDELSGDNGGDYFDGGSGFNWVTYLSAPAGVDADLVNPGINNAGDAQGDFYVSIQALRGSPYGDHLYGDGQANAFEGLDGNDLLVGRAGNDQFYGGTGDDMFDGGAGGDYLEGDDGIDTASYSSATQGVFADFTSPASNTNDALGDSYVLMENLLGSAYADHLGGNNVANSIEGGGGADTLFGYGGNDTLIGGGGNDTMSGGTGDDTYYVDSSGDVVNEDFGAGTDTVYSDVSYTLTGIVEILYLISGSSGTGNGVNNTIHGNASANTLDGGAGADTMVGGDGGDFLDGGAGGDALDGGAGFDLASWLSQTSGLTLNLTNQGLNAGTAAGDTVTNVEALYLTNSADSFTAGPAGLFVYGFGGNDTLIGSSQSDFFDGGAGGDTINAGGGFDYVSYNSSTAAVTLNLQTPASNTGHAAGDAISNADAYILTEFGDTFIGLTSGQNIVFGYGGNDTLTGGFNANNWLFGGSGNDRMVGGGIADLFVGDSGADTIVPVTRTPIAGSSVFGFTPGADTIEISRSAFGLSAGYAVTPGSTFAAGTSPANTVASPTFLYYTNSGLLYFDPDGTGSTSAALLMQFAGAPALAASDFHLV